MIFTKTENEIDIIIVQKKSFLCYSGSGLEYSEASDGKYKYGFPFKPYLVEKMIDEDNAYLVDAKMIIWTFSAKVRFFYRTGRFLSLLYISDCDPEFDFDILGYPKLVIEDFDNIRRRLGKDV